jgi:hypothetical protein
LEAALILGAVGSFSLAQGAAVATQLQLDDLRRAWDARDPELGGLLRLLVEQPEESPATPVREGALTFDKFLAEIRSKPFRKKPLEEQAHYRVEQLKAIEAPTAEVPLSERLKVHEIIGQLWEDNGPFARACLLRIIADVPLTYGPWRALKRIFKESEARGDTQIYGALAARLDMAYAGYGSQVSKATLAYLCRRAWRYLRRLAVTLPVCYADTAVDFLDHYTEGTNWYSTWVANHIFYHETGKYNRGRFTFGHRDRPKDLLKHRAFGDLWRRTPRPLFSLLERARCDQVREFATAALKADFRASLREVEPAWVARLVNVGSKVIDEFVVWILNNVPRFEQSAFRTLGLHEAVLRLFDSSAPDAQAYAAEYARTHARDLPVGELVRLIRNSHPTVRKLARDLLQGRDPRKEVGLEAWGQLLETSEGHELAATTLRKHFGAKELTPEWFQAQLFTTDSKAFQFLKGLLPQIHPFEKLGLGFFSALIDRIEDPATAAAVNVANFALDELARFDLNALDVDFLKRLLLHPRTTGRARDWINEGRLKTQTLPVDFFKALAFHPAWESDPGVTALKQVEQKWARQLEFDEGLSGLVLGWLQDPRRFSAKDLGIDWLMQLVARSEPQYHDFATNTLIRALVPADFAPQAAPAKKAPSATVVDLGGATILFTGELASMTRKEAQDKVKAAKGANASSVTPKLHYLVIGDEGSPLYGQGKKGSKQTKAEELNAAGANIRIISETAFLQMLAGEQRSYSEDATLAGCERLWQMVVAPGPADAPVAQFARKYVREHHPEIHLAETDRPVDPGAEIPPSFLTFDRVKPLFGESRQPLREFALDLARYELARWAPPIEEIIKMAEVPYADVRELVTLALLADESPEHRRYRVDPAILTPSAVYSFCESADEGTRTLGMKLIERSPRLQVPEELFRLTESPDRRVRAFVIRALWSLYRDRGIKEDWKPYVPPQATVGAAAKKKAEAAVEQRGTGAPHKPDHRPADDLTLNAFLRRMLFEIPPGRMQPSKLEGEGVTAKVKPLPARKAKLYLVEALRDLAVEDTAFAGAILPLLREFMTSRGKSERDACIVAVTRIRKTHPDLAGAAQEAAP